MAPAGTTRNQGSGYQDRALPEEDMANRSVDSQMSVF